MLSYFRTLVLALLFRQGLAKILQVVDRLASPATDSQILQSFPDLAEEASVPLFSSISWRYSTEQEALNELLQASFDPNVEGIQLCQTSICDKSLCLHGCISSINDPPLEGTKIVDLCHTMTDVLCIGVSSDDVKQAGESNAAALFQALLREQTQIDHKVKLLIFIFNGQPGSENEDETNAQEALNSAWNELGVTDATLDDVIDSKFHAIPKNGELRSQKIATARNDLANILQQSQPRSLKTIAATLPVSWGMINRSPPRRILTKVQRAALFRIESAYDNAMRQLDMFSEQWRVRIDSQKLVGDFGKRAETLLNRTMAAYDASTLGVADQKLRAARRQMLFGNIQSICRLLYEQQVVLLSTESVKRLQKSLVAIARQQPIPKKEAKGASQQDAEGEGGVEITEPLTGAEGAEEFMEKLNIVVENEQEIVEFVKLLETIPPLKDLSAEELKLFQALVQVNYWLYQRLKGLEAPTMGIVLDNAMKQTQLALRAAFDQFPSSPAAQLAEIQLMENQVKQKEKGGFKFEPRLDIVMSIEAPGMGGFQGYLTYALPFGTLFLAATNDRDSEVNMMYPPPPMLRIQPKIHFDVDLP